MNRADRWQARARAQEPRLVTEATRLRCEQACATHTEDLRPHELGVLEAVVQAGSRNSVVQRHQLDAAIGILSRFPELTMKRKQTTEGNAP